MAEPKVALDEGELAPLQVKAGDPQPQAVIYVHDLAGGNKWCMMVRGPGERGYHPPEGGSRYPPKSE